MYWRLRSIPELSGLAPAERKLRWQDACRRAPLGYAYDAFLVVGLALSVAAAWAAGWPRLGGWVAGITLIALIKFAAFQWQVARTRPYLRSEGELAAQESPSRVFRSEKGLLLSCLTVAIVTALLAVRFAISFLNRGSQFDPDGVLLLVAVSVAVLATVGLSYFALANWSRRVVTDDVGLTVYRRGRREEILWAACTGVGIHASRWYVRIGHQEKCVLIWWTVTVQIADGRTQIFNSVLRQVSALAALIQQRCPGKSAAPGTSFESERR